MEKKPNTNMCVRWRFALSGVDVMVEYRRQLFMDRRRRGIAHHLPHRPHRRVPILVVRLGVSIRRTRMNVARMGYRIVPGMC